MQAKKDLALRKLFSYIRSNGAPQYQDLDHQCIKDHKDLHGVLDAGLLHALRHNHCDRVFEMIFMYYHETSLRPRGDLVQVFNLFEMRIGGCIVRVKILRCLVVDFKMDMARDAQDLPGTWSSEKKIAYQLAVRGILGNK
jgi:hypothetical protein